MITKFKIFEAREDGDYWGNIGAGVLPICTTTGRILLAHRSPYVYEPNTYNVWGGKIDEEDGETESDVKDVAKREFIEETQYDGNIKLIGSYVFYDKNVFTYYNFIGLIDEEFKPKLNWETQDYEWLTYEEFLKIEPKHFGLKELIHHDLKTIKRYAK
jgi:8-oxo-dGTP pyrophosphatase MutT (NUDIX family)